MSRHDLVEEPPPVDRHQLEDEQDAGRAESFIDELLAFGITDGIQPFVLPALTVLARVRDRVPADSAILLGAQNAHWADEGGWTGEISMRMAKDAGATLIEIGHSERREHFGETDNAQNATDLLSDPHTDGLFIGRAAWEASGLIEILRLCAPLADAVAGQSTSYGREQPPTAIPSAIFLGGSP